VAGPLFFVVTPPGTYGKKIIRKGTPSMKSKGPERPPIGHPLRCPDCNSTATYEESGEDDSRMWIYLFHSRGCPTWSEQAAGLGVARENLVERVIDDQATKEHLLEGLDPKCLERELRLCEGAPFR